jgi:sRNA-binding regulator protein Hfq
MGGIFLIGKGVDLTEGITLRGFIEEYFEFLVLRSWVER